MRGGGPHTALLIYSRLHTARLNDLHATCDQTLDAGEGAGGGGGGRCMGWGQIYRRVVGSGTN